MYDAQDRPIHELASLETNSQIPTVFFDSAFFVVPKPVTTLPKTNIAPEIRPSQKETSIPTTHFQVLF